MKVFSRFIQLILLLLLLFSYSVKAQWYKQTSSVSSFLNSVYFINDDTGWIAGDKGILLNTTDGGINWNQYNLGIKNILNSVFFVNENVGWIVGGSGLILKTTDGGKDWFNQNSGGNIPLNDVFFINENDGWIGTYSLDAEVLRTTDGGASWKGYPTGLNNALKISFTDVNNGWVGEGGSNIAHTTDGGITWTVYPSGTNTDIKDIFFVNQNVGWTFGSEITKTTDGGKSWSLLPFNEGIRIEGAYFLNEKTGWIEGFNSSSGDVYKTTDGGKTWQNELIVPYTNLLNIFIKDSTHGWVVGYYGFIASYSSAKFIKLTSPNGGERWQAGSYYSITWRSNYVKKLGLEYSTDNGNKWILIADSLNAYSGSQRWDPIPNTPSDNCLIKAYEDSNGSGIYDVSDSVFTIYSIPTPPGQWEQTTVPQYGGGVFALAARDSNLFVSAGGYTYFKYAYGGGVFLSTDNGKNWKSTGFTNMEVYTLAFIDSNLYASAYKGVFLTSDNGLHWTQSSSFPNFNCVVQNDSDIFLGTYNGIIKSSDNGKSWRNTGLNRYVNINSIIIDGSTFFAGGSNVNVDEGIFQSVNNGTVWNNIGLRSVSVKAIDISGTNIIAGTSGGIYVSTDSGFSWNSINISTGGVSAFANYNDILFAGCGNGVYKSTDEGITWFNVGLSVGATSLIVKPPYLFAGTGNFVYRRLLSELTGISRNKDNPSWNYSLQQNYPNPFNPTTTIEYSLPKLSYVTLKIYDILGREVATLVNEEKSAGNYKVEFDGSNLSSGVYFYNLEAGNYSAVKKLLLLK